jgi:hypothetical protein
LAKKKHLGMFLPFQICILEQDIQVFFKQKASILELVAYISR